MRAKIGLEELEEKLDVILYKDANELFYFKEIGESQLAMSPNGGIMGFKKIEIYEKVIICYKLSELFNVFFRGTKKWLSYLPWNGSLEHFDFYNEKPEMITDDFILLCIEGARGKENACFVFDIDSFVSKPGDPAKIGLFDEVPFVRTNEEGKIIIFSRDKRKSIFLVGVNTFVRVPSPSVYNKEDFQYEFLHVQPSYVVLKMGSDLVPDFFVYSFIYSEYKNIYREHDVRLDEKYWKPSNIICNEDYIALCYVSTVQPYNSEWEVRCAHRWNRLKQTFTKTVTTDIFDDATLEGKCNDMILIKKISDQVSETVSWRD